MFYAQGVKANVIFFDNHEASPNPWTKQVWYYDYRTNIHHTLKKKPMHFEDLSDFINCYNPQNRHQRKATYDENDAPEGRWRSYSYEEISTRDKTSLDIFWLKDKSLTELDNLPDPDDLAEEIIENLEAGLSSFREVLSGLQVGGVVGWANCQSMIVERMVLIVLDSVEMGEAPTGKKCPVLDRNACPVWPGIDDWFGPEYAYSLH